MGGNALDYETRRYQADEYYLLEAEVLSILRRDFPDRRINALSAYRQKESFGDMDVLFQSDNLTIDIRQYVNKTFAPKDIFKNGNTLSFEYKDFQIDLILMPSHNYDTSLAYYGWNDLGNITGRVAKMMGLKLGHEGLVMVFTDEYHQFAEENLSKDTKKILEFLGYDYETFAKGFDTLEDIFRFSVNTPFFNKGIYALENRNHQARTRDNKRKTYSAFLEWLETAENLPAYPYKVMSDRGNYLVEETMLPRIFEFFPEFEAVYHKTMADHETWKQAKAIFNGEFVSTLTGLTQKDLGMFMKTLKEQTSNSTWVVEMGTEKMKQWVLEKYKNYSAKP